MADIMIAILKVPVNGGFKWDVVTAYEPEVIVGPVSQPDRWFLIVRSVPYTLPEAIGLFCGGVKDVTGDPDDPIATIRRARLYIDHPAIPGVVAELELSGWADTEWLTVKGSVIDAADMTLAFP